jgi:CRISPR system Cascade subunit CasA
MTLSFNLTTQPWIPCERLTGERVELSTRDVLAQAHELRAIADPSPLQYAVLHRHLMAVLYRSYAGPRSVDAWCEIAESGRFGASRVEAYLSSVRARMDLFHPEQPFAQARGLKEQFDTSPIDALGVERSSWGTARELFQHRGANHSPFMSPAAAARALLAHHAFATGGLVKKPGEPTSATAAPLVRSAVVILRGETLFRTLLMNLVPYDVEHAKPIAADKSDAPSWEQEPPPAQLKRDKEPAVMPKGWLDLLTWLSRRIELTHDGDRVTGFVRAVWKGFADDGPADPMVAHTIDEKRGRLTVGFNPDKAFWLNAHALFHSTGEHAAKSIQPAAIRHAASRDVQDFVGKAARFKLELCGLAAEKSRVDLVRVEHLSATAALIADPETGDHVRHATAFANQVVKALRGALWAYAGAALAPGDRNADTKDVGALARALGGEDAVWAALGETFRTFLDDLSRQKHGAIASFENDAIRIARATYRDVTSGNDGTGRTLRAIVVGEDKLALELAALGRVPTTTNNLQDTSNASEVRP